jgi:hypothetical protein
MTNPFNQFTTPGVRAKFDSLGDLWVAVLEAYKKQPDVCLDGGNDKEFFSMVFKKVKLFVAANEINGLTVMLPEEY